MDRYEVKVKAGERSIGLRLACAVRLRRLSRDIQRGIVVRLKEPLAEKEQTYGNIAAAVQRAALAFVQSVEAVQILRMTVLQIEFGYVK